MSGSKTAVPGGEKGERFTLFKYLTVGATGFIVNTVCMWSLTEILGVYYLLSSLFAIEAAIISNFLLNNFWTFRERARHDPSSMFRRALKFNLVSYSGDWINVVVLYILSGIFGVYYLFANTVGIASAVLLKFLINSRWTWRALSFTRERDPPISDPTVSVIIPTYNERPNIESLVKRILSVFSSNGIKGEIIVVDDNSPDGTWRIVQELGKKFKNVKLLRRSGKLGLSTAVIAGFRRATGNIVGVMDADFSHPPEKIPELVRPIASGDADITIGSRYIKGGAIKNWPLTRRIISKIAGLMAMPLTPVRDPMAGFFFMKRGVARIDGLNPKGFKILLEILVKSAPARVREIPITFANRSTGESKLSRKEILDYISHCIGLYKWRLKALSRKRGGLSIGVSREAMGFSLVVIVNLVLGFYLNQVLGLIYSDAFKRTADAFLVINNNHSPQLTAVGVIWLPLPAMLQIPFVLAKWLAVTGLASTVLSSIFSALSLVYLNKVLCLNSDLRKRKAIRYAILLLYYLNPMILLYSINGMTEIIYLALMLGVFYHFYRWLQTGSNRQVLASGLLLALAAWVRYEAWFFTAVFIPITLLAAKTCLKYDREKIEGIFLLYFLPVFYMIGLWFAWNWMIMGNPLYFLSGPGSAHSQASLLAPQMNEMTILYKSALIFPFALLLGALLTLKLLRAKNSRESFPHIVALFFLGYTVVFNLITLYNHSSFEWLRHFLPIIPFSFAGLISLKHWKGAVVPGVLILLVLSNAVSGYAVKNVELVEHDIGQVQYKYPEAAIDYIKDNGLHSILMHSFNWFIMLKTDPKLFVDDYDGKDFEEALRQPYGNCSYILVTAHDILHIDKILRTYPSLGATGRPEVTLLRDFNGTKIYRVDRPFVKGIFSIENFTFSGTVITFDLQNYDDPQPFVNITLSCSDDSSFAIPFNLRGVNRLENKTVIMPAIPGCKEMVLRVAGQSYNLTRTIETGGLSGSA